MGYLRDFVQHVADSFTSLFNLDADPALTEHENVERVIGHTATVAAIVSMVQPIPAADFLILTPIQAKMALHIGRMKGFDLTQERAQEIVVEVIGVLGMTLTAQLLIVSVAKLLPIVGGMLSVPLIYAATWAIGNVVDYYFDCLRSNQKPSAEVMKDLFTEQFRVGKARGQALDKSELERKAEELRRKVAERDDDLQTETRLTPRAESKQQAARAANVTPPPSSPPEGGRPKIKITLGGGGAGARGGGGSNERMRGKKTIGPDAGAPEDDGHDEPGDVPPVAASAPSSSAGSARKTLGDGPAMAPPPSDPVVATKPAPAPMPSAAPSVAAVTAVAAAQPGTPTFIDQLERLGKLRAAGVLTADEFEQAKRKILGL